MSGTYDRSDRTSATYAHMSSMYTGMSGKHTPTSGTYDHLWNVLWPQKSMITWVVCLII